MKKAILVLISLLCAMLLTCSASVAEEALPLLPDTPAITMKEMGIDIVAMWQALPSTCNVYVENGVFCIEASEHERSISFSASTISLYASDFHWQNNRWESIQDGFSLDGIEWYSLFLYDGITERVYSPASLEQCTWYYTNCTISCGSSPLSSVGIRFNNSTNDVYARYKKGELIFYSYNIESFKGYHTSIEYNAHGDILQVLRSSSFGDAWYWTPATGWYTYDSSYNRVSCDAPTSLFQDYQTETDWKAAYPPLLHYLPSHYAASLPTSLQTIESGAFTGTSFRRIYIPDGMIAIGSQAFSNCTELEFIRIPASVTTIADDAFSGVADFTIITPFRSYAESYAKENGIPYITE